MKRYETWKNVKQRGGKNKVSKAMWKCRRGREKRGKKCRDGIKKNVSIRYKNDPEGKISQTSTIHQGRQTESPSLPTGKRMKKGG